MQSERRPPETRGGSTHDKPDDILVTEVSFCALDLETTGLSSLSRIVEVGAVRFRLGEQDEQFQTLVDPGCAIPRSASRVHGITDEMVRGAPPAPDALQRLAEFSEGCVLVAHNARYDSSIVSTELLRAGMRMPQAHVLCTIKASKRLLPRMPNYRLQTVAETLEIFPEGYHRALSDAVAARMIFEKAVTFQPGWRDRTLGYYVEQCTTGRLGAGIEIEAPLPDELEEVGRALGEAIEFGSYTLITYRGGARPQRTVQVRPLSIFCVRGNHYLDAACADGSTRSFRLDRISRVLFEGA